MNEAEKKVIEKFEKLCKQFPNADRAFLWLQAGGKIAEQSEQSDEVTCTAQYHIMLASKGDSFCGVCRIPLRR